MESVCEGHTDQGHTDRVPRSHRSSKVTSIVVSLKLRKKNKKIKNGMRS
jgi:hypothetical protein